MTLKNKKIIAIMGALVFTMIILTLAAPKIKTSLIGEVETVYQLKGDIKEGDEITEDNLVESEVNKSYIPKNVEKNKKNILGRIAKTDIFKYDYITKEKLAKENEGIYYNEESKIISITLQSQSAGVSGRLKKGDIVRVLGYSQDNDELGIERVATHPELRAVEVISVTTSSLKEVENIEKSKETSSTDLPSTIILRVKDDVQLEKLIDLEYGSKVHLAFLGRGEYGKKLLEEQDELIKKQKELSEIETSLEVNELLESGGN